MNQALIEWLSQQDGISEVTPISIRIENEGWEGAKYKFTGHYERSMMAVAHGDKKAGEPYYEERFYFLGERPKSSRSKQKKGGVCYMGPNGETFYISCYIDVKDLKTRCSHEQRTRFHPFGPSFMLGIWPEKFGPIDQGETLYKRIPLSMSTEPVSVN